ncbi:hypothetical protein ACJX0J_007145, partial [Zea mays]
CVNMYALQIYWHFNILVNIIIRFGVAKMSKTFVELFWKEIFLIVFGLCSEFHFYGTDFVHLCACGKTWSQHTLTPCYLLGADWSALRYSTNGLLNRAFK